MKINDLKNKTKTEIESILATHYWSENESVVIECTLKGYSVIQIADRLWVSPRTINRIRKIINEKLNTVY